MSYQNKVGDLLDNAEKYHQAYYRAFRDAETFGGPSLHFHRRALATRHSPGDSAHLEYVYATLAFLRMHRMGKGGSKRLASGSRPRMNFLGTLRF